MARLVMLAVTLLTVLVLVGASVPSTVQQRRASLTMTVAGSTFSISGWMAEALVQKFGAAIESPASDISLEDGAQFVQDYLARSQRIAELERGIEQSFSERDSDTETVADRQAEMDQLRNQQAVMQPIVEQVIERQVASELAAAGITFPPVQFTFSEPPKKLVVSPRDRIETAYYRMIEPAYSVEEIEAAEASIFADQEMSAYVTRIGGMGAFPAMVVDRASLPWLISTVAHEWTHNYLFLFPLGLSYNLSPELTIINETVAEIVGNEVGQRVIEQYYHELLPGHRESNDSTESSPKQTISIPVIPFDFRTEMRETRRTVDTLLAEGKIDEAETYMERRRQFFVNNGYPLRVLNQAYFAFHGSYGTSAASSDPIGPKLFHLREISEDVPAFLRNVRGITSASAFEQRYRDLTE